VSWHERRALGLRGLLQLNVYRFATIEDFVERFGPTFLIDAGLLSIRERTVAGAARARGGGAHRIRHAREMTLIEAAMGACW
jgi:hypothetical protein